MRLAMGVRLPRKAGSGALPQQTKRAGGLPVDQARTIPKIRALALLHLTNSNVRAHFTSHLARTRRPIERIFSIGPDAQPLNNAIHLP